MLITVIAFILTLSILVLVHELGHFFTAKLFGAKAEEFGFGLPPRAFGVVKNDQGKWELVPGKTKKEFKNTIFSLNWIPVGGFVKVKGESGEAQEDKDSYYKLKSWQKSIFISAGVAMNLVLAAVILSIGFMIGLPSIVDGQPGSARVRDAQVQIFSVVEGSPAKLAGVESGDFIISIDDIEFDKLESLQSYVQEREGQELNFVFLHQGEEVAKTIAPAMLEQVGETGIGVGLAKVGIVSYPWYISIYRGLEATVYMTKAVAVAFYELLKNIIVRQEVAVDLQGPVGIAVMTGKVARMGFVYVMQFTALLSINLAIVNFLPFPALDGGRLLFLAIEKLRGRPVSIKIENLIHNIGFMLLMILVVLITYRDLMRVSDKIINSIRNLFGF